MLPPAVGLRFHGTENSPVETDSGPSRRTSPASPVAAESETSPFEEFDLAASSKTSASVRERAQVGLSATTAHAAIHTRRLTARNLRSDCDGLQRNFASPLAAYSIFTGKSAHPVFCTAGILPALSPQPSSEYSNHSSLAFGVENLEIVQCRYRRSSDSAVSNEKARRLLGDSQRKSIE